MNIIHERISALRTEMEKLNLDAWYISGTDPHSSEYLPERWKTRAFISGFTGSYGTMVITREEAGLWTDTRYFIQAQEQLNGTGIEMYKLRVPDAVLPENWMAVNLNSGSRVGIDAQTISVSGFTNLRNILFEKNIELVQTPDLFENIWEDRPCAASNKIFELDIQFTGFSRIEKHKQVVGELMEKGADLHLFSMLDEVAWLYNLRGSDVSYNPVFEAFSIVGKNVNCLFVDDRKIPQQLKTNLKNDGVELRNYKSFYSYLRELKGKKVLLDPATANYSAFDNLKDNNELTEVTSVVSLLKARKNSTELSGFRSAMQKDGVALVMFLYWLKQLIGKENITEFDVGQKLKEFRSKQKGFRGESFPPIVGYKEHGAIVHLSVGKEDALQIEANGILLFDSGGQYLEGTTDITRTVALGKVTEKQKKDYTFVLKGMIALTQAKFPYGTKGCHLDILARKPLWENGMNYGHGTGHGVGHFLNVHEGPMSIRQEYNENKIEPGNVMSNEPAFYREGEYGIRTENMIVCVEGNRTEYGQFLEFETLTLCPIDKTLIVHSLFNDKEKRWLNDYHKKVNDELKPLLAEKYHGFLDRLTSEL